MKRYDVCIVGAGAAGLAAAASLDKSIKACIIEKNEVPGRKIMATGGGRCNITNAACAGKDLTLEFFKSLGLETYADEEGRYFPYSNYAPDVVESLMAAVEEKDITVMTDTPVMDINRIRELLPHRYPFLLVDKIIEIGQTHIVGVKNISVNEPFFQGHFPEEPVMPGVLQIEAMAQTGGLLVLNTVDEPERYSTYFMKIDGVKFRQKVVPGDTLILRLELLAPIRRGISTMKGYVFVGDKLVSEAEFMAQIIKNK